MALVLESPAFRDGGDIPAKYARDGDNVSPPLLWRDAPGGTRSYLLFVEDPDAPNGVFRHWAAYDIPADRDSLPENASATEPLRQAQNDFGHNAYDGPQPPPGHGVHHYHFRLFALDADRLNEGTGSERIEAIMEAAEPHVLGRAELIGTFEQK